MKKRVLFICGGISGEHEISLISAKYVLEALDVSQFTPCVLFIQKTGAMQWVEPEALKVLANNPRAMGSLEGEPVDFRPYSEGGKRPGLVFRGDAARFEEIDVAFPILHGTGGEDGSIQGLLETAKIPFVGAGIKASAIGMDKALTKKICMASGLPVVPFVELQALDEFDDSKIQFPCFVKPASSGSSLGVSRVENAGQLQAALEEAFRFGSKVMIEPAIAGREIEIAVLDDGKETIASPIGEIVCGSGAFYSYDAKYVDAEAARLLVPAELPPAELAKLQGIALGVFKALGCRGLARIDFFRQESDGSFLLNEINTMPGFTPISMYPKLMACAGVNYSELLTRLIESARFGD